MVLAVAGLLGAGLAWIGITGFEEFGQTVPRLPVLAGAALLAVAAVVGLAARRTRRRIVQRERMDPQRAVRLLVLGKTALIAGVGLAAGYLTTVGIYLPRWDAPLARERVLGAAVAALAAAALAVAGWFLEAACEVPRDPDDSPGDDPDPDGPSA